MVWCTSAFKRVKTQMHNTAHYNRTQCLFHHTIFMYQVKIHQLPQKKNISLVFQVIFLYKIIYDCQEGSDKEVPIMFDDIVISYEGEGALALKLWSGGA